MVEIEGAREKEHVVLTLPVGGSQNRPLTDVLTKKVSEQMFAVLVEHQKGSSEQMTELLVQHQKGMSEKCPLALKNRRVERKRD